MKRSVLSLSIGALVALSACNNAANKIKSEEGESPQPEQVTEQSSKEEAVSPSNVSSAEKPAFSFEEEMHDFGSIEEGTVAKHDFTFTNTGNAPLVINNARGSCGCTVPEWPREPIAPGETGTIHVEFNSTNRTGAQQKQVTLTANTVPNKKVLRISAQVQPNNKEKQAKKGA